MRICILNICKYMQNFMQNTVLIRKQRKQFLSYIYANKIVIVCNENSKCTFMFNSCFYFIVILTD